MNITTRFDEIEPIDNKCNYNNVTQNPGGTHFVKHNGILCRWLYIASITP